MPDGPRVALLTREYPPEVYGGAGVHVEYLARELDRLVDLTVHCFGEPRPDGERPPVVAHTAWEQLAGPEPFRAALSAVSVDLAMAAALGDTDLVHSHTWYANLAGHLAKLLYGIPHVVTTHSLRAAPAVEGRAAGRRLRTLLLVRTHRARIGRRGRRRLGRAPPRPPRLLPGGRPRARDGDWQRDRHVGVPPRSRHRRPERNGVDPNRPIVLFVGRITRQKGLTHLLDAAPLIDPGAQLVLCAGAADTPELAAEIAGRIRELERTRAGVVWIEEMLPKPEVIQLLTHATVFVCPSIYEPLGIVNLEAMACETAVVATATGGIPEVVEDGVTGLLVPFDPVDDPTRTPRDPAEFAREIAERVNRLLDEPDEARRFGLAGRRRAEEAFSWTTVAERVAALYRSL